MGGKKPLRRPLWPPTRATASNYYPLGLDGAGGAAKPLLRAPKKPAPLHGRLPAFSGAVDAFERARKCFLEWRYFFSIILSEFLKNRVALQFLFLYQKVGKRKIKKLSQHVPLITGGGTDKFTHVYDIVHIRVVPFYGELSHQFRMTSGSLSYCPEISSPHS